MDELDEVRSLAEELDRVKQELKDSVLDAYYAGRVPVGKLAAAGRVSVGTVYNWINQKEYR